MELLTFGIFVISLVRGMQNNPKMDSTNVVEQIKFPTTLM